MVREGELLRIFIKGCRIVVVGTTDRRPEALLADVRMHWLVCIQ